MLGAATIQKNFSMRWRWGSLRNRTNNRNQHYVQKRYLQCFSKRDRFLGAYIKEGSKFVPCTSIADQCSKKFHHGDGDQLFDVESWLKIIEGAANAFLKDPEKLICHYDRWSAQKDRRLEWEKFLCHVVTQMARTPVLANEPRPLEEIFRDAGEGNRSAWGHTKPTHNLFAALTRYSYIFDLVPALVRAPKGSFFITSDFPVVATNFAGDIGIVKNNAWSLDSAGLVFCYPLSEELCLILFDKGIYCSPPLGKPLTISSRDVFSLNVLQILNCDKAVYSGSADENYFHLLRRAASKLRPRKQWIDRIDRKKVLVIERRQHAGLGGCPRFLRIRSRPRFYRDMHSEHDLRQSFVSIAAAEWEAAVIFGHSEVFEFGSFLDRSVARKSVFHDGNLYPHVFPGYMFKTVAVRRLLS